MAGLLCLSPREQTYEHSDNEQDDERQDGNADTAPGAAERMPHFFVEVEPAGRRFSNHRALAQPPKTKAVAFLQIFKAHRA